MATVPSAETSTGGTPSSIPPAKTQTPAAFASSITACASRPTAPNSPSGTTIAALGKEIRYLAMVLLLGIDGGREACVRPNGSAVQLRPTRLTVNAGAQCPPPERYHASIGTSCWASAATAC